MKKILLIPSLLTIGLMPMVSMVGCNNPVNPDPTPTDPTSIMLNETALTLNKGETFELKASIWPKDATCSLEWSSSDTAVATVDSNGVVTAQNPGNAVITVQAVGFENVKEECSVKVNKLNDYLTVTALEDSTFRTYAGTPPSKDLHLFYSFDGDNWKEYEVKYNIFSDVVQIPKNSILRFRGPNLETESDFSDISFLFTGKVALSGSIMSLLDNNGLTTNIPPSKTFTSLFQVGSSEEFKNYHNSIVSVEELVLPDTDLTDAEYCYSLMFAGCEAIEKSPRLPAKKLSNGCYYCMFAWCTSLKEIKLDYTGNFTEDCFYYWVEDVPTTGGTFYYNGNDTENFGISAIPGDSSNHWEVKPLV